MNKYTSRKKKKMKLQMDGQFPLLPSAPAAANQEKAEVLQVMIREFMAVHYQLACGKESPMTPWGAIAKHQSMIWDSDVWPPGVIVQDPSKIVLGDCQKIVTLWRERQAQGGASYTFKFNFYVNSEGLRPAVYSSFTPAVSPHGAPMTPLMFSQDPLMVSSPQLAESIHRVSPTKDQTSPTHFQTPPASRENSEDRRGHSHHETPPDSGQVHPESDPPVQRGKHKAMDRALSTGEESSDVSTDPDGRKSRKSNQLRLQRSLINISPEPVYDNDESLPPRLGKKTRSKAARKANGRRNAPPARQSDDDAGGNVLEDTGGEPDTRRTLAESSVIGPGQLEERNVDDRENVLGVDEESRVPLGEDTPHQPSTGGDIQHVRNRIKPKPKPLKKKAKADILIDDETQEEQRIREDNLFIVRKSGRMHKPKYNIAPPAQLRLEKEREASRNRK